MKKIGIIAAILLVVIFFVYWVYASVTYPTTSPLNTLSYFIYSKQHPHTKLNQQVIGFLPYWRLDDTKYTRFDLLSEVNYFSLTIDKDGNFLKKIGHETEPGWRWWNSKTVKDLIAKTKITGNKFTLTLAMQDNKAIESFLDNKNAQEKLVHVLLAEIKSKKLDGINLDFEYTGEPDAAHQKKFTSFATNLSSAIKRELPNTTINLSLLPLAAREKDLFDFPKLIPLFDHFIGMSYDYYRAGSDIAGPVAPMDGFKENKYFFDVATTYEDYRKFIPEEKLIMGVPYYGWDWAVRDGKKIQSTTLPQDDPKSYAAVLSYGRMRENTDLKQEQCQWDDYAKETWCWYTDKDGIDHQVWLEDNRSISEKFMFAKTHNFSGIALWTLGYDKAYPDLWNLIHTSFDQQ